MNLWRRGAGFTFQQRVPNRLAERLGNTPFRVSLGLLPLGLLPDLPAPARRDEAAGPRFAQGALPHCEIGVCWQSAMDVVDDFLCGV